METPELNGLLYNRICEAARVALEKCVREQRLTKENFDKTFMELYNENWKNWELIKSKA